MTVEQIFDIFLQFFPPVESKILETFQNGKNSIRIRGFREYDVIFTYNSEKDWELESVESFISKISKGVK